MASELASENFHPPSIPSEAGSLGKQADRTGRTGPREGAARSLVPSGGGQHRVLPPGRFGTSRQRCPRRSRGHVSLRGLGVICEGGSRERLCASQTVSSALGLGGGNDHVCRSSYASRVRQRNGLNVQTPSAAAAAAVAARVRARTVDESEESNKSKVGSIGDGSCRGYGEQIRWNTATAWSGLDTTTRPCEVSTNPCSSKGAKAESRVGIQVKTSSIQARIVIWEQSKDG
eukprot:6080082-Pleurochrysis_carterae.AAC.1